MRSELDRKLDKVEMILAGYTMTVDSNEEVSDLLRSIRGVLSTTHGIDYNIKELMENSVKYCKEYEYKAINIITFDGMVLISLVLKTDEDPDDWSLTDPNGVLAYVYNATYPDLSELGYIFLQEEHGKVRRVS